MKIIVTGDGISVTDALKQHIEIKLQRIKHHFEHIDTVHVTLRVEKLVHTAEAGVSIAKNIIHACAEDADMYTAIDDMADMIDKQLLKHKEKIKHH